MLGVLKDRIAPSPRSAACGTPNPRRAAHVRLLHRLLANHATHLGVGIAILLLDYWTGPLLMFPILFVLPVALSAWWCSRRLAYFLSVLLPVGRFGIAALVDHPGDTAADATNALVRIAVLAFLAFLVARTARQAKEIKVLHGLLPICMFCKRIRDERAGWQPMEVYITRHSEADFSHGLCPECAQKNYGSSLRETPGPRLPSSETSHRT